LKIFFNSIGKTYHAAIWSNVWFNNPEKIQLIFK
jgi:hypothetical protein